MKTKRLFLTYVCLLALCASLGMTLASCNVWGAKRYTVTVDTTGIGTATAQPSKFVVPGQIVTLTYHAERKPFDFKSWEVAEGSSVKFTENVQDGTYTFVMPDSDITVRSTFTPGGAPITIAANEGIQLGSGEAVPELHSNRFYAHAGKTVNLHSPHISNCVLTKVDITCDSASCPTHSGGDITDTVIAHKAVTLDAEGHDTIQFTMPDCGNGVIVTPTYRRGLRWEVKKIGEQDTTNKVAGWTTSHFMGESDQNPKFATMFHLEQCLFDEENSEMELASGSSQSKNDDLNNLFSETNKSSLWIDNGNLNAFSEHDSKMAWYFTCRHAPNHDCNTNNCNIATDTEVKLHLGLGNGNGAFNCGTLSGKDGQIASLIVPDPDGTAGDTKHICTGIGSVITFTWLLPDDKIQ